MKKRLLQAEQLDNFELEGKVLHNTLKSLAWVNKWLGNYRLIRRAVLDELKKHPTATNIQIVDLGCGGGDILRMLATSLPQTRFNCSFLGIEGNPNTVAYAKAQSKAFPQIDYLQADILSTDFTIPSCDLLISSHFLYHFDPQNMIRFFTENLPKVRIAFINSGLERSKWAFLLFQTASWLMPVNRLARIDGAIAIQRAFTFAELHQILNQIPNSEFQLHRVPLFRLKTQLVPIYQ